MDYKKLWPLAAALILLIVAAVARGITKPEASPAEAAKLASAKLVDSGQAIPLLVAAETFVLDVHTPQQEHLPGTDEFIHFDQVEANRDKLPVDKTVPILVYCRSGNMSRTAGETLVKLGYTQVYDLAGGIEGFKTQAKQVLLTPSSRDLGTVIYGDVARTQFLLVNLTNEEIEISKVSTSCGCTKAKTKEMVVAPWSSIEVEVLFDPAVHQDDTDLGELTRSIYIDTDSPDFPRLTAEIKANVRKQ